MNSQNVGSKDEIIEAWVKLFTDSLFNWAFFKTSDKETAEDLVQDTFLAAYQQIETFNWKSSPKTWLLAILNNKILSFYRLKYKGLANGTTLDSDENAIFNQLFDKNERWKKDEIPVVWNVEERHLLDDLEFNRVLNSCISRLPEHWRSAITLKYIEEKKGELICQELEISATNFWQILHRAKLQLRKCLEVKWFKA